MKLRFIINEAAQQAAQLPPDCFIAIKPVNKADCYKVYYATKDGSAYEHPQIGDLGYLVMDKTALKWQSREYRLANNVWEVSQAFTANGYGPLLYDVAMELANTIENGAGILKSDSHSTSPQAEAIWNYYLTSRSDVKKIQLDSPANDLTPSPKDNVPQKQAQRRFGKDWSNSALSKGFIKGKQILNSKRILWLQ